MWADQCYINSHHCYEFISAACHVQETESQPSFCFLCSGTLWALEGMIKIAYLAVIYSQPFGQLWVSALTITHEKQKLLWPKLRIRLISGYKYKHLEGSWTAYSFSKTTVRCPCPLSPITSQPIGVFKDMNFFHLESNHKLLVAASQSCHYCSSKHILPVS